MLKVMYDIGFKGNRPKQIKKKREEFWHSNKKKKKPTRNFGVLTLHETDVVHTKRSYCVWNPLKKSLH